MDSMPWWPEKEERRGLMLASWPNPVKHDPVLLPNSAGIGGCRHPLYHNSPALQGVTTIMPLSVQRCSNISRTITDQTQELQPRKDRVAV